MEGDKSHQYRYRLGRPPSTTCCVQFCSDIIAGFNSTQKGCQVSGRDDGVTSKGVCEMWQLSAWKWRSGLNDCVEVMNADYCMGIGSWVQEAGKSSVLPWWRWERVWWLACFWNWGEARGEVENWNRRVKPGKSKKGSQEQEESDLKKRNETGREKNWKICRNDGRETDNEKWRWKYYYHLECYVQLSGGSVGFRTKLLVSIIRSGRHFENPNRNINKPEGGKKDRKKEKRKRKERKKWDF